ncbi:MAG: GatB/YqeY domain-containing protein [Chloroflexia bacterium]|nr:GatB/YqeY domain-containing protein [Chloroflexia bacterium]
MNLTDKINNDIKEAMKAKQADRLLALRAIKSEILLAQTSGAGVKLDEEAEIKILQKLVKQRKDSAETYQKAGRNELYEKEIAEVAVIEEYLPAQLSDDELVGIINKVIAETGATSIKEMGKVIGEVNKLAAGRAEGKVIAQKVKEILS